MINKVVKPKIINKAKRSAFRHDMPRIPLINRYRMQGIISRQSRRFQPTIQEPYLRAIGLSDPSYLESKQFWVKKKKFRHLKRLRQMWNTFGERVLQKLKIIPLYYFRSGPVLKYWYRHKFPFKRRTLQLYFKFVRASRRIKGRPRAAEFRNPIMNMFSFYWGYLGKFFARPSRKTASRAKSFLYWRAAWLSQLALSNVEATLVGNFYDSATTTNALLRALGSGQKFKVASLWYGRWWWAKVRQFLIKPISSVYRSRDLIYRSRIQHNELFSSETGAALSEVDYVRTLKTRILARQTGGNEHDSISYARNSLGHIVKRVPSNNSWHTIFGHPRHVIKTRSGVFINSLNFLHTLTWVSPFINAFIRAGSKYFVETLVQRALLFLRVYLGWVFDFSGQVAQILDRGRPLFRFVIFVRKMKKRKRKTWTVPKALFKNRGYVYGARRLWMRLTQISGQKFIDRMILMIEELTDAAILQEFVTSRYEQALRASKLRRWMRFLKKKYKRTKLRSILRTSHWWRYSWNRDASFAAVRRSIQRQHV